MVEHGAANICDTPSAPLEADDASEEVSENFCETWNLPIRRRLCRLIQGNSSMKMVCILEDDLILRLEAASLLQEAGLDAVEFASADLVLAFLEKNHEHVCMLFADIRLPSRLSGLDLVQEVARRWPAIRLVLTSGVEPPSEQDIPISAVFMSKPWQPSSVLAHALLAEGAIGASR
jgi:two-component system, response regulator PdtaR